MIPQLGVRQESEGGDDTNGERYWVAAWTNSPGQWSDSCYIKVIKTADSFDSYNSVTLNDSCTIHQPAVNYSTDDDRFVLMYSAETGSGNDEVFARTSADGLTWTSPQSLGFDALGGPSVACSYYGNCMMSFISSEVVDPLPKPKTRAFTIDSNGQIVLGAESVDDATFQKRPAVDDAWDGVDEHIFMTDIWASYYTQKEELANGLGSNWTIQSTQKPFPEPFGPWDKVETGKEYRGDIASNNFREVPYLFMVY